MSVDNVNDIEPRDQYTASAAQTEFDYTFPIFEDGDLVVYVDGALQALTTDYTVTGAGDDAGGTITFLSAMTGGEIVTIYRDLPIERTTDFQTNGPNRSSSMNDELDRMTMVMQQLKRDGRRAIRFTLTSDVGSDDLELNSTSYANKYLAFDEDGKPEPAALSAETMTRSTIGELLYPITAAEIAAGVTPVNYYNKPAVTIRYAENTTPGTTPMAAAFQAAIKVACASNLELVIEEPLLIESPVTVPHDATGCIIRGASHKSYLKYTGTGAMITGTSTPNWQVKDLTLIGPGSSINATAISAQTSDYAVGVFDSKFSDLTIEGFQTGLDIAGQCRAAFSNINMGLSKSGIFTGTDQESCPLIGIKIGTTVLDCTYDGMVIFAKQRCIQQTTSTQLCEGLKFSKCTFDLRYNDGTNANQSCVYFESGQDVSFDQCWFTNSQKYGTASSYIDRLVYLNHQKGSISAPMVTVRFNNCVFYGNGFDVTCDTSVDNCVSVDCNWFYIYSDLRAISFANISNGFSFIDNKLKVTGTNDSGKWKLFGKVCAFDNITRGIVANNRTSGNQQAISTVVAGYFTSDASNDLKFQDNVFPVQDVLTPGSEIVITGTNSDVVVIGEQQTQNRQFTVTLSNTLYSGAGTTIASINTNLSKPRMAIVEVNFGSVNVSGTGYLSLNQGSVADRSMLVPATGSNVNIMFTKVMIVSGTITLSISGSTAFTPASATSSNFRVTLI